MARRAAHGQVRVQHCVRPLRRSGASAEVTVHDISSAFSRRCDRRPRRRVLKNTAPNDRGRSVLAAVVAASRLGQRLRARRSALLDAPMYGRQPQHSCREPVSGTLNARRWSSSSSPAAPWAALTVLAMTCTIRSCSTVSGIARASRMRTKSWAQLLRAHKPNSQIKSRCTCSSLPARHEKLQQRAGHLKALQQASLQQRHGLRAASGGCHPPRRCPAECQTPS